MLLYLFLYRLVQVNAQWDQVHQIIHLKLNDLAASKNIFAIWTAGVSSLTEWVAFHTSWWYKAAFITVVAGLAAGAMKVTKQWVYNVLIFAGILLAIFVPPELDKGLDAMWVHLAAGNIFSRILGGLVWLIDRVLFRASILVTVPIVWALLFGAIALARRWWSLVFYLLLGMAAAVALFGGIAMMPLFLNWRSLLWFLGHLLAMWIVLTAAITFVIPLMRSPHEPRRHRQLCAGLSAFAGMGMIAYTLAAGVYWLLPAAIPLLLFAILFLAKPQPSGRAWPILALTLAAIMGLASSAIERLAGTTVMSELHGLNALPAVKPAPPQPGVLAANPGLSNASRLIAVKTTNVKALDQEVHNLDAVKKNYLQQSATNPAKDEAYRVAEGVQQKIEQKVEQSRGANGEDTSAPRRLIASLTATLTFWITASLILLMVQPSTGHGHGEPAEPASAA